MFLVSVGAVAFIGYLIWLIICIRNYDSKIPAIIGMLLSIVMIVGGISASPTSDAQVRDSGKSVQVEDDGTSKDSEPDNTNEPNEDSNGFSVGEPVDLNDVVVTLVNVRESEGSEFMAPEDGKTFILCEFEIENNSKKDINVSSMLSFEAYIDGYTANQDLSATVSSDKSQLDGTVASGKKMNGEIGYQASKDWSSIEIRFTPDFWSRKDIEFVYKK